MQVRIEYSSLSAMSIDEQVFEELKVLGGGGSIVVGIGNILKGDDAAGVLVCQQLEGKTCAKLMDTGTVPENYIQPIIRKSPESLVVIDAIDFGAAAGTIKVFRPEQLSSIVISTHTLSPRLFVDMICQDIKVAVYFVGIQPGHTQLGEPMSEAVAEAVERLVYTIAKIFPAKE